MAWAAPTDSHKVLMFRLVVPTLRKRRKPAAMIDRTRQEILRSLERLSELTPDVRFGQLIANLPYLAIGPSPEAIWEMDDEQLLVAVRQYTAELSRRQPSVA